MKGPAISSEHSSNQQAPIRARPIEQSARFYMGVSLKTGGIAGRFFIGRVHRSPDEVIK
jgi:hypothetical protein